jgi:starvation-inducible DNA-binding protein
MKKVIELLNQYVADLSVMNVKFHNLHWNVTGKNFKAVHEHLEALYDALFETYDEAAERIKMLGDYPMASVKEYLQITKVKELESKDVETAKAFEIVKQDFMYLKDLAIKIRAAADEVDDFGTVMILEDHVAAYDKELYFINQTLK